MANLFIQNEQGGFDLNPDVTANNAVTGPDYAGSKGAGMQATIENAQTDSEGGETVDAVGKEQAGKGGGTLTAEEIEGGGKDPDPNNIVKPDADASGTVAGGGKAGGEVGAGAPSPTMEEPKMVPTHNLEDRGRADDSVIAGILKKAGIDAKDDAKRDRINKIMASVGAGMNMLQAIANIGAASRNNGRFVGNIDVAKGIGDGVLADTARRKERDAARQTAIDKRAAQLDALDAEQRKAEREAAQKALDWQRKLQLNNYNNAFKAAENARKLKADALKADKDRASKEAMNAATIKAANARNAANIQAAKERNDANNIVRKEIASAKGSGNGKGSKPKTDEVYIGKDKDGNKEYVNISSAIATSPSTTGKFAEAWNKLKSHPEFETFVNSHQGDFKGIYDYKNKTFKFNEIEEVMENATKPNAKMLTVLNKFLMDYEDDKKAETEAIRELFRQMAAEAVASADAPPPAAFDDVDNDEEDVLIIK